MSCETWKALDLAGKEKDSSLALGSRGTSLPDACLHTDPPVSFSAPFICPSLVPIKMKVTLTLDWDWRRLSAVTHEHWVSQHNDYGS